MTDEELRAYIANRFANSRVSPQYIKTKTVTFRPSTDTEEWRAKALSDLRDWMLASTKPSVTAETWASVYIRCGECYRGWKEWMATNVISDDLPGWIESALRIVTEKRWI